MSNPEETFQYVVRRSQIEANLRRAFGTSLFMVGPELLKFSSWFLESVRGKC